MKPDLCMRMAVLKPLSKLKRPGLWRGATSPIFGFWIGFVMHSGTAFNTTSGLTQKNGERRVESQRCWHVMCNFAILQAWSPGICRMCQTNHPNWSIIGDVPIVLYPEALKTSCCCFKNSQAVCSVVRFPPPPSCIFSMSSTWGSSRHHRQYPLVRPIWRKPLGIQSEQCCFDFSGSSG